MVRPVILLVLLILTGCATAPSGKPSSLPANKCAAIESGEASYYGDEFHGRKTASGEQFNQGAMTAAHKTLPFGTRLVVENRENGWQVAVRVNDRGPFVRGRVVDLSKAAAREIGMIHDGVVPVTVRRCDS